MDGSRRRAGTSAHAAALRVRVGVRACVQRDAGERIRREQGGRGAQGGASVTRECTGGGDAGGGRGARDGSPRPYVLRPKKKTGSGDQDT